MRFLSHMLLLGFLCSACSSPQKPEKTVAPTPASSDFYDMDDIQSSGELIMLTLYGPDTYYEFQGHALGTQYRICQEYAASIGARVRVEVCSDVNDLFQQLNNGQADLIANNIPVDSRRENQDVWCGDSLSTRHSSWVVRRNSPELAASISAWFDANGDKVHELVTWRERQRTSVRYRAHMSYRASIKDEKHHIISDYDGLFRRYCRTVGWDWRLLAAQAYQESGFDPTARSWTGAEGLMQFMPSTARDMRMDVNRLSNPEVSVSGAVKYLHRLSQSFPEIRSTTERTYFMLAAYNCGLLHVKDAQRLAQKYGKNPNLWYGNVEEFVLRLQQPRYYRDPVVQNGYCRGSETYNYVRHIMGRYQTYREKIR